MSEFLNAVESGENLPPECWQLITNRLNGRDLEAMSLVSKGFLSASNLAKRTLKVIHPNMTRYLKRFPELKSIDLSEFQGDLDEAIREITSAGLTIEALTFDPKYKAEPLTLMSKKMIKNYKADVLTLMRKFGSNPKMIKNLKVLNLGDKFIDLSVIPNWSANLLEEFVVHLRYFDEPTPASMFKVLRKIHLSGKISDQFLDELSIECVLLKDVTLSSCCGFSENGVGLLFRNRPNLEALSITGQTWRSCFATNNITIANSINYAKALTCLQFGNIQISDNILLGIERANLHLKDFRIIDCVQFTFLRMFGVISNHLNKLSVGCPSVNFTDKDLRLLLKRDVSNLTHIEIGRCQLTNSTLFVLSTEFPSLVEIKISVERQGGELNNDVQLGKNHNIRTFSLTNCKISDDLLEKMSISFPNLSVLRLLKCWPGAYTMRGIDHILKRCKFMTELELMSTRSKVIKLVSEARTEIPKSNLEVLTLSGSVDEQALAAMVKRCPRLMSLDLSKSTKVGTKTIKDIVQNIQTLTCLRVEDCKAIKCNNLRKWVLSTGCLASLKKIILQDRYDQLTQEQKEEFLLRNCVLF